MRRGFCEYRHFSITAGREIARLSIFDERGDEFHMTIPVDEPKFRTRRAGALEMIAEAMTQGCEPGEVRVA